ncbi:hypothetical protein A3Q56_07240 [Intoshia linei]|uniref:Uncharacterized protein n=1 Tax=Intoshia linei TaxID=1819745 RepID=A0A177AST0_9BILA|nr:hypothetical protein A3Q56_07240 [Intoshia linei]
MSDLELSRKYQKRAARLSISALFQSENEANDEILRLNKELETWNSALKDTYNNYSDKFNCVDSDEPNFEIPFNTLRDSIDNLVRLYKIRKYKAKILDDFKENDNICKINQTIPVESKLYYSVGKDKWPMNLFKFIIQN